MTSPVFYFDFNSPYAYLAAERIEGLIPDAEWRPIAFPMVLHQLGPLRAAVFAGDRGRGPEFARAAFRQVFVASRCLSEAEVLGDAVAEAGLDPAEVAEAVQRTEIKERLKELTNGAFERGITGIPTVEIGEELFWGDDHLEEATAAAAARR